MNRKKELDKLVAAFGNHLRKGHPNPERVNCPGRAVLISVAGKPLASHANAVLAHIRKCAACLDELKELRLAAKRSQ